MFKSDGLVVFCVSSNFLFDGCLSFRLLFFKLFKFGTIACQERVIICQKSFNLLSSSLLLFIPAFFHLFILFAIPYILHLLTCYLSQRGQITTLGANKPQKWAILHRKRSQLAHPHHFAEYCLHQLEFLYQPCT